MTLVEREGGLAMQQKHCLLRQEYPLYPLFTSFSLSLLLTSETTRGALPIFLFQCMAEVFFDLAEHRACFSRVSAGGSADRDFSSSVLGQVSGA
jgi:hypothetical protein